MSKTESITPNRRLQAIRDELTAQGEVQIADLAKRFNVSEMTIRRDLEQLEQSGEIIRTHGGATLARRLSFEFTFRNEQQQHAIHKQAIGRKTLDLIRNGQTIILDTGSTTLEVARALVGRRAVRVITISLPIVSALQFAPDIETILLGGHLRSHSPDMHGALTEQNLAMFRADLAIMGAAAIDDEGTIYADDLRVVNLDKKMIEISERVAVVADGSKFQRRALCQIIDPGKYHAIVTDPTADAKTLKRMARQGVEVLTTE